MATHSDEHRPSKSHLAQVFAQYPIEVAHGDGVWLHARDGRKILDFYGGHAVAGLGYGHPRWLAALERQARQMSFQTNALPIGDPRARRRALDEVRGL
jgi:acetylornithine/N-succinyldiaminopimelate aminotransferase